jgi:hypothetical protein
MGLGAEQVLAHARLQDGALARRQRQRLGRRVDLRQREERPSQAWMAARSPSTSAMLPTRRVR